MTYEHDTRRVSKTYRDIAKETSPANLDDKIMTMARQEARTRYGLARAWIRPVAWAATIGLSFAFILEMTYFSNAGNEAESRSRAPALERGPAAVSVAPEIKANEMPALREADASADEAAASYAEDVPAAPLRQERASLRPADNLENCDAEDRKDADSWYRCILVLREQGRAEAAKAELDALREAFPDFREPVPE